MSGRRYERDHGYNDYRSSRGRYRDERGFHDEYSRPPPPDYPRRPSSPRRRPSPPPYDRRRESDTGELKIKGASNQIERSSRNVRQDDRESDSYRRPRSPSPRYTSRPPYRDRDAEGYRSISPYDRHASPGRGRYRSRERSLERDRDRSPEQWRHRSRSCSHVRRRERSPFYGGPPSREVMLEGLPPGMIEDDISAQLTQHHNIKKLDDVRVIRDRQTKVSRCFGFIRFPSLEDSKAFVEPNYPTISFRGFNIPENTSGAISVRIAYSRERDERGSQMQPGDWRCQTCGFSNFKGRAVCYQCQSTHVDSQNIEWPSKPQYKNSGDSDVSPDGTPSQFLIIRGLEPTVTEDLLAKGVSKLLKPNQPSSAQYAQKKGSSKVLSTTGDSNLGAKEGTLRRVLLIRDRRTNDSWRYGFAEFSTVDDAQAAFVRYHSFDKFTIASKPVTADYVHAGIFVPTLDPNQDNRHFSFSPLSNTATKLMYWDQDAFASELVVSQVAPLLVDGSKENQSDSHTDQAATADKDSKAKKRKADSKESSKQKKATPAHLQFWSDRHAELHGQKQISNDEDGTVLEDLDNDDVDEAAATPPTESYIDFNGCCCWLCMRQFQDKRIASQHERTSGLHRKTLKDEDAVSKAKKRLLKHSVPPDVISNTWIDLTGACCYLCDLEFDTTEDTSRHENISVLHRENISNDDAVRKGKALIKVDRIVPTTVADPYLDPVGKCCYLCMTEFKTGQQVFRHAYMSQLHRSNLKDEAVVKAAIARVGKRHKIIPQSLPESFIDPLGQACYLCQKQFATDAEMGKHATSSQIHRKKISSEAEVRAANVRLGRVPEIDSEPVFDTSAEYRDRAAERRQAFGTSKKISLAFKKPGSKPEESAKSEPQVPTPSKGASLLGKMGWSAGEGLGAQGTGMTAPIATDLYMEGVGLGAQGGKIGDAAVEAGRNTKSDYNGFLERTKDKAKERFEKMT